VSGRYQNEVAKTGCKGCPKGEYQNNVGQTGCKFCTGGKYQETTGNSACKNCPAGFYMAESGAYYCKACVVDRWTTWDEYKTYENFVDARGRGAMSCTSGQGITALRIGCNGDSNGNLIPSSCIKHGDGFREPNWRYSCPNWSCDVGFVRSDYCGDEKIWHDPQYICCWDDIDSRWEWFTPNSGAIKYAKCY
jgi:hypothetical protein